MPQTLEEQVLGNQSLAVEPCRIWPGCLASYNQGELHGEWIDIPVEIDGSDKIEDVVDKSLEDVKNAIQRILETSPAREDAEEYGLFDTEGFVPASIHEYENIRDVVKLAVLKARFGDVVLHMAANHGISGLNYIQRQLENNCAGAWESLEAWGEQVLSAATKVYEHITETIAKRFAAVRLSANCRMDNLDSYMTFDVAGWARDMEMSGYIDVYHVDGQVYVFWA